MTVPYGLKPCIRCGYCCIYDTICDENYRDETGICKYLRFDKDITTCILVEQKDPKAPKIGVGCTCPIKDISLEILHMRKLKKGNYVKK